MEKSDPLNYILLRTVVALL